MKANELMVGNWVYDFTGEPYQVEEHRLDHAFEWNPIPLNKERLDALGFSFNSLFVDLGLRLQTYQGVKNTDYFAVELEDGDGHQLGESFNYVHEIQNVFYAITRKHLPIKLA